MSLHLCNLSCTHFQNCPDSVRHFLFSTRPPDTWKALHKTRHIKKEIKWRRVVLCMADSGSRYHVPKLKMIYFEREKGHLCRHWNKDYSHKHAHTTFSFFPSYICSNPTWKTLSLPEGEAQKNNLRRCNLTQMWENWRHILRVKFPFVSSTIRDNTEVGGCPGHQETGTLKKKKKQVPAPNFQQMARQNPHCQWNSNVQCNAKQSRSTQLWAPPAPNVLQLQKLLKRRQHSHLSVNLYRNVSFGPWKASESKSSGLRRE